MQPVNSSFLALSHRYRSGERHPSDMTLFESLSKKLEETIQTYRGFNEETFDPNPLKKIRQLCDAYGEAGTLLLGNEELWIEFFKWAIRDNNAIEPFLHFPELVAILKACNLSQRIGFFAGKHLQMLGNTLKLSIEGQLVDLQERTATIVMRDGTVRTIQQIFDSFKAKSREPGDLEFSEERGITYFPTYQPWKVMDLEAVEYWKTLPVLKTLTLEEVQERFGKTVPGLEVIEGVCFEKELIERGGRTFIENDRFALNEVQVIGREGEMCRVRMRRRIPVDGTNFLTVLRATSEQEMSFAKTHAFADVYIPLGDGRYQLYSDGKYPKVYPTSQVDLIKDLARTVPGVVQVVDDNLFYNHRNHVREPIGLDAEQGRVLMEIRRFLIALAKSDNITFEFQSEGCAKMQQVDIFRMLQWLIHEKVTEPEAIKERVAALLHTRELEQYDRLEEPNFFRTQVTEVRPEGILGSVCSVIRRLPLFLQPYFFSSIYLILGAWRGMPIFVGERRVTIKRTNSVCWDDHSLYHPGLLQKRQQELGITLEKRKEDFFPNASHC